MSCGENGLDVRMCDCATVSLHQFPAISLYVAPCSVRIYEVRRFTAIKLLAQPVTTNAVEAEARLRDWAEHSTSDYLHNFGGERARGPIRTDLLRAGGSYEYL